MSGELLGAAFEFFEQPFGRLPISMRNTLKSE
ncbi:hypothetical protein HISP_08495 [Haloarcula hispanica N601]|uniref:Uncharacterized protein n=1 Tax=Haloarcula hispanica N601 TaxID=1417673 RepID=V5TSB0_HALHI|nr:hypothetical protein HISP_08495 [Haloarcula hispanica N601]